MRLLAAACLLLMAACSFHPGIGNGAFLCGPGSACPPDMTCARDGRCYHTGMLPNVDMGPCTPKSCSELALNCGAVNNGCGVTMSCGLCDAPNICGGGGAPNVCGCQKATCEMMGWNCGSAPDGCGDTIAPARSSRRAAFF